MLDVVDTDLERGTRLGDGSAADGIPAGLDRMAPGPVLAAFLASIDVDRLSGYDRIVVLRAHHRMANHYLAHTYRDMAAVTTVLRDVYNGDTAEAGLAAEAEIRAALTWTRRMTESELGFALDSQQRLPRLFELLESGAIDVRKARVIVDGTMHLPIGTAQAVTAQVLDDAPGLTTGQLQARVKKLCIATDPEEADDRYTVAVQQRRVTLQPSVDGTAHLHAFDLPPHDATAAMRRISALARAAKTVDDPRTPDQIRTDVYLDLLCGRTVTTRNGTGRGKGATVDIRVDLDTLTGLNNHPGELAGYGPVIADIARNIATGNHDAEWRYTVTDPETGRPLASGTTTRRPTTAQRRIVETIHPTCVFPGCRMPATDCDLDHRQAWANGGPTTVGNLAALCKHDHRIKHEAGWQYRITPDGQIEWTSQLGHTYPTARPPP